MLIPLAKGIATVAMELDAIALKLDFEGCMADG